MANGPTRLWMGLALGSVLVVGLSAGLLADRLLAERRAVDREAAPEKTREEHPPVLHFDCRGQEERQAAAIDDAGTQEHVDATRSEDFREHRSKTTRRMARRLELEPEQVAALEPIVEQAMLRGRSYWTGARDEFCSMEQDFHRQVNELLSPDQAARFDRMRRDLMERGRRHSGRNRGDRSAPGECH